MRKSLQSTILGKRSYLSYISISRLSKFFQMNEKKHVHKVVIACQWLICFIIDNMASIITSIQYIRIRIEQEESPLIFKKGRKKDRLLLNTESSDQLWHFLPKN